MRGFLKKFARSLRFKTLLIAGVILAGAAILVEVLISRTLVEAFDTLQASLVRQQVERFRIQLSHIGDLKILLLKEYTAWDETYDFIQRRNESFLADYYEPNTNTTEEDVAAFFDLDRQPVATRWMTRENDQDKPFSKENLVRIRDRDFLKEDRLSIGILVEDSRVMLVAAGPILHTDQSGPHKGWLIHGRWVDAEWLNRTFELVGMRVSGIRTLDSSDRSPDASPIESGIAGIPAWAAVNAVQTFDYEAKIALETMDPSVLVEITAQIPMHVLEPVVAARTKLIALGIGGSLLLIVLPLIIFERLVLRPIGNLERDIGQLSSDRETFLKTQGKDEFARLSQAINALVADLKNSEGNVRAIFEAIGDPIFVHGYQADHLPTRFRYVNTSACELLGRSREELLAMGPGEVDDIAPERIAQVSARLEREGRATFDTLLIASDGRRIPVEIHANSTVLSGEKVCISVARSLVARKIIDAQMREAREAAEAANRAKSEFLATMSHEIRTPLNGVIGFATLLDDSELPATERELIAGIKDSSRLLLALVNDVLDFSRIEAGQLELDPQPMNLIARLNTLCAAIRLQAEAKGLAFHCEFDPRLPREVVADSIRIEQVLGNLFNNALKFTRDGEITFHAAPGRRLADGGVEIVFVVRDTGIGISEAEKTRLFHPFGQADSSLSRRYGGSGLGLVIVKRLCELMGGRIQLRSEPGRGTEFTATIRVGIPAGAHDAVSSPALPAEPPPAAHRLRVLVVEDNALNQKLMSRLLARHQSEVTIVGSGGAALDILERETFDLILMDVGMPVMDGLETTRRIRRRERETAGPPRWIVALTAGVTEAERQACANAGMDGFLGKPITSDALLRTLDEAMRRRASENG